MNNKFANYYAIKIMKNLDNEGVSQSILREISLVNSLTHPCILKFIIIIAQKKKEKTIFFF